MLGVYVKEEDESMKKVSVKTIVATGIGAALFFVLGRFVAIPSGVPNTNISIQYGLLAFIASVFGPVAGLLAGLIGHFFIDFSFGYGIWWSWVVTSALVGLVIGLISGKLNIENGQFTKKDIITFNVVQIIANVVGWAVIAPVLDIVMYAEPANKVFVQGIVSAGLNSVATAIVGTLLCAAYAKTIPQKGSLKEED